MTETVFLTGTPMSGQMIICKELLSHPEIGINNSSVLYNGFKALNYVGTLSNCAYKSNSSQFDSSNTRLENAIKGFMAGWNNCDKKVVIDNNPEWMNDLETLKTLDPSMKVIICIRDPVSIFAALEEKNRKTQLVDFEGMTHLRSPKERLDFYLSPDGPIGKYMHRQESLYKIRGLQNNVLFVRYEDIINKPKPVFDHICNFLGVNVIEIKQDTSISLTDCSVSDPKLSCSSEEEFDSNPLVANGQIMPGAVEIIEGSFDAFYKMHYPEYFTNNQKVSSTEISEADLALEEELAKQIEAELEGSKLNDSTKSNPRK